MQQNKLNYFFSQPHQPFFVWGVLNAILCMLLFLLSYKGIVVFDITPNLFHAYSLTFIVFTAFFQGFLLTTFPRFSQMPPLEQKIYTTNFTLLAVGTFLFFTGVFSFKIILYLGMIILLANQAYSLYVFYQIYKGSPSNDKYDQFWILIAFLSGLISNILIILATISQYLPLEEFGKQMGIYLYLLFVALSVAQRMIPFFSHVMIEKNRKLLRTIYILLALGLITNLSPYPYGFVLFYVSGILLAKEIYRWKLPFKKADPILWILHLAIFWLPVGLLLGGIAELMGILMNQNFIFITIHLVMLGFVTTVLIGFGTRVTLGHSGNMMVTDNQTKMLFYMTQAVVYMRALYSFTGTSFLYDIAVALWLLLFIGWSIKYLPALAFGKKIKM